MPLTNKGKELLLSTIRDGFTESGSYPAATRIYLFGTVPSANYFDQISRFGSTEDYIVATWGVIANTSYELRSTLIGSGNERRFTVTPAAAGPGDPTDLTNVTGITVEDSSGNVWFTGTFDNTFNFYSDGTLTMNFAHLALS